MSVLIKGMKMPKHCWQCGLKDSDDVIVWDETGPTTADEFERLVYEQPTIIEAEEEDPEPTMEEFMYGQDPGDPEDGRL